MGRPPIIVKERVAEVTLRLIDQEGLDAVSIERIASELGVRGPSLYHHFADKSAILTEVARLVLGDLDLNREVEDWQQLLIDNCLTVYRRVLEHPLAATILLEFLPETSMVPAFGVTAQRLTAEGIDPTLQILLMEGAEKIAWGWALHRAMTADRPNRLAPSAIGKRRPELLTAVHENPWSDEKLVEMSVRAFLHGATSGGVEEVSKPARRRTERGASKTRRSTKRTVAPPPTGRKSGISRKGSATPFPQR